MDKFRKKYRIQSSRLQNWNYGWNGVYFVTICTFNRISFFGNIEKGEMKLSEIGSFANKFWLEIPRHFSFVSLNAFCIMPNHFHGILIFNKKDKNEKKCMNDKSPSQLRYQNQGKNTLSSVVGSYKSVVSKNAHPFMTSFKWQDGFYDLLIQDNNSLFRICHYIQNNPANWESDEFHI
jgi:putative transposase